MTHKKLLDNCFIVMPLSLLICLSSCVSQKTHIVSEPEPVRDEIAKLTGFYHHVSGNETLWSIARTYDADLNEIIKINRIPSAGKLENDQLIFIPSIKKKALTLVDKSSFSAKNFSWPVKGKIISYFGNNQNGSINNGIDIRLGSQSDINASRKGRVVFLDELSGYGKTLILDHLDGFFTVYSGAVNVLVKMNDNVNEGQAIAKGNNPESPNNIIHFEIRQGYRPRNPLYFLP